MLFSICFLFCIHTIHFQAANIHIFLFFHLFSMLISHSFQSSNSLFIVSSFGSTLVFTRICPFISFILSKSFHKRTIFSSPVFRSISLEKTNTVLIGWLSDHCFHFPKQASPNRLPKISSERSFTELIEYLSKKLLLL